jgi:hypothetical protein
MIAMIGALSNTRRPSRVMASVPTSEGKKTDEGTMTLPSTAESNPVTVVESPETQTLTPATTKEISDMLINCRNKF